VFDDAGQFPAEIRRSAFVVLKGSWNRSEPSGDTVVCVPFRDGKGAGDYEHFWGGVSVRPPVGDGEHAGGNYQKSGEAEPDL
jgi:glucose/arabinose dehydrogenase